MAIMRAIRRLFGSFSHTQDENSFVRTLLDSATLQDLRDSRVGIIKGDYVAEKKTMLYHAATSDSYGLFSGQQASIEANCLHGTLLDKPSMSKTKATQQRRILFWGSLCCIVGYFFYLQYGHLSHHKSVGGEDASLVIQLLPSSIRRHRKTISLKS